MPQESESQTTVQSKAWDWKSVTEDRWTQVAEEFFPVGWRWKSKRYQRVLDLGAGIGRNALFLADLGMEVVAFDLSADGLVQIGQGAREKGLPIELVQGNMLALPYAAESFDGVLAFHTIYHTDRIGLVRVIADIFRVLKAGGELFVTFNSRSNPSFTDRNNEHVDAYTVIPLEGIEQGIPHYYVDEPEVRALLAAFEITRLVHLEEIRPERHTFHYFVQALKPRP